MAEAHLTGGAGGPVPGGVSPVQHGSKDPKVWLRQRVKPPRMPEIVAVGDDGQGMLCGYLEKNFERWSQKKSKLRWHKRWFVLDKNRRTLYYYKAGVRPEDLHRTSARGWINLGKPGTCLIVDQAQLEADTAGDVMPNHFQLRFPSETDAARSTEVLDLSAPSNEAYNKWVSALKDAIAVPVLIVPKDDQMQPSSPVPRSRSPTPPPKRNSQKPFDTKIALLNFNLFWLVLIAGGTTGLILALAAGNAAIWWFWPARHSKVKEDPMFETGAPSTNTLAVPADGLHRRHSAANDKHSQYDAAGNSYSNLHASEDQSTNANLGLMVFNLAVATVTLGGVIGGILILVVGNGAIWKYLQAPKPKRSYGVSARSQRQASASISEDEYAENDVDDDEGEGEEVYQGKPGASTAATRPLVPNGDRQHVPKRLRHVAGQTVPKQNSPEQTHCWSIPDPASFNVRIGPNYARNKQKAPSKGKILSPVAVDLFSCNKKVDHIMRYMQLPTVDFEVAHWLIVNVQFCNYAPSLVGGEMDGPGMSFVIFNPIPTDLWGNIQSSTSGHLELLRRFLNADQMPNPESIYDRVKIIASLVNTDSPKLNFNATSSKLLKSYNAKPVLSRPQHRIIHADFYTELDINVHEFSYMARRGLAGFLPKMKDMVINVCLVLEGHSDSELPEVVLTCLTAHEVDFLNGKPW